MKEMIKIGISLLLICSIAALALSFTNELTKDKIDEQRQLASEEARKQVLPDASEFKKVSKEQLDELSKINEMIVEAYTAVDASGSIIGYVFKTTPTGFGGNFEVTTGISLDGTVTGLRVGTHNETPGLGAKATDEAFYSQYVGKLTDSVIGVSKTGATGNDIQAITGATITSKAVSDGANASISAYKWLVENGGNN